METERQLQERVKHWLIDDLHYKFLGNLENLDNSPVIEELLKKNLAARNYSREVISKAVSELDSAVKNQSVSLYQSNEKIYNLLRYGDMCVKDKNGNDVTVNYIDWKNFEKMIFMLPKKFRFYAPTTEAANVPI